MPSNHSNAASAAAIRPPVRLGLLLASALCLGLATPPVALADVSATSLGGSWRASGTVSFATGSREPARCRVSISPQGANSLGISAICATQDGTARQFASLDRVGPSRFAGDFRNPDYNVNGRIVLTVSGSRLTASLTSDRGTALLNLTR